MANNQCPHCGHPNPPAATFCGECGRPLPAGRPCPDCSFTGNPPKATYCVQCGAPLRRRSFAPFVWLGGLVLVLVLVGAIILWQTGLLEELVAGRPMSFAERLPTPTTTSLAEETAAAMATAPTALQPTYTPTSSSTPTQLATATPLSTATQPPTATPPPTVEPTVDTSLRWSTIGKSVQGRDIEVAIIGDTRGAAVVVVGSIQGDQPNTRDLINSLVDDFNRDRERIPANVAFHFIPTINPDGDTASTRRNAHNVDLNRNWDTFDWTANPEQPEGVVRGAGGSRALSEPETQSLADYLLSLQRQNSNLRLVLWHSSQRLSSSGHVYPGYTSNGLDRDALNLAWRYVEMTGYVVKEDWAPYETTGELITWCAEEDIEAIDIVIPRSLSGADRNLRKATMEALLEIARLPYPPPTAAQPPTATPPPTSTSPPTYTPSPTPCAMAVYGAFSGVWQAHASQLGCPSSAGRSGVWMAGEDFQHGRMFWRKDNDKIYVLYNNGRWKQYDNIWRERDPVFTCGTQSSPPTPLRGFGKVWCTYSDVRQGLGDATNGEWGDYGAVQDFDGGLILQTKSGRVYIFYSDGTWRQ